MSVTAHARSESDTAHARSESDTAHARSESDTAPSSHLDELDDEQREAVLAARGPVCVLAGAGTGKTRTITRRIAHLVTAGHVAAGLVLAVTYTPRAPG